MRPANPGWVVGVCVCLCTRSACTPLLLAGLCGVGVCAWARVSAAPRHAGLLGCVCVCVRTVPVPCYSWPGCAVWVCVLALGFRLRAATPGWVVGVCVCLCVRFACTLPLLAGVCGVGAFAWARVSAAPRHSWLGCWGVCVFVCALRLYPFTSGWGVRRGCVYLGSRFGCAPPLLAGVLGCVCVCVRALPVPQYSWPGFEVWVCVLGLGFRLRPATPGWAVGVCVCLCARSACTLLLLAGLCGVGVCACTRVSAARRHSWLGCWGMCVFVCPLCLYPATPGWGVRCGCVCLGSGFGCAPPFLAGVLGCVCVCVRAPLVLLHSWLGCAAWVYVFGLPFRLRPATPGLGVGVCVCLCTRSACGPTTPGRVVQCGCVCLGSGFGCAPPVLAGLLGCVCVCVRAPLVARHSWLGFVVCGLGVAWHLFLCRGPLRVVRAHQDCGTRWPLLLGTCPCAVVVPGGVPLWRASWPCVGAPRLVRSGRCRCSGRLF